MSTQTGYMSREPLLRVVKRAEKPTRQIMLLRAEALVFALVAGGVFILLIGYNPFEIYGTILSGAFRSKMAIQATVKVMIPLLISSLGVTLAFKMKFWNIGAEGQIIAGAICASYFALYHSSWNHVLLVTVMFLAGIVGGGLWGLIPALFRVKWGTNETLFTLMLNYIALHVVNFLRDGPWKDPGSQGSQRSPGLTRTPRWISCWAYRLAGWSRWRWPRWYSSTCAAPNTAMRSA